jgi:hypothetical protein
MKVNKISFGTIKIDGIEYNKDIIINKGTIENRKKKESKKYKKKFGHTPLSLKENIPWKAKTLIIGTGHSNALPVMDEVIKMARKKGVRLKMMSTKEAVNHINDSDTNLLLHLTC